MKHLIYFLMIVDHAGWLFYPNEMWIRFIGHIFLPMFIYFPVLGLQQTKQPVSYITKLLKWALITQAILIGFWSLNDTFFLGKINILFTLSWGLIMLMLIKEMPNIEKEIALIFIITAHLFNFEYGAFAVWGMYLFYFRNKMPNYRWWIMWSAALTLGMLETLGFVIFAAILPPHIIFRIQKRFKMKRIIPKLPSLFWYAYYPAQFAILMSIFVLTN